jgi:hypothetical protein
MACGCLPLAERTVNGIRQVDTILVTRTIRENLEMGGDIDDDVCDGLEGINATSYLDCLPASASGNNYFDHALSTQGQGQIYDFNGNRLAEWGEVVAGIAFGGLVPMATKNLVELVKFTVNGNLEWPDNSQEGFTLLEKLACKLNQDLSLTTGLKVFGSEVQAHNQGNRVNIVTNVPGDTGTRVGVETMSRFTTILERLMALTDSTVEDVFQQLKALLTESYNNAVLRKRHEEAPGPKRPVADLFKLRNDTRDCAAVAWCIISAWTRLVRIVDWEEAGTPETQGEAHVEVDKSYHPLRLTELPDVSAWH